MGGQAPTEEHVQRERWQLLRQLDDLTDGPLTVLGFVWLGLLVVEFTTGLNNVLRLGTYVIWGLFALDFAIEFTIAPHKRAYLRHNWLTALALVLPAFRILRVVRLFRLLRAARAARSVSLLRLLTSVNRGMRSVRVVFGRRGFGYVVTLTMIVTFAGAAGMAYFESPAAVRQESVVSDSTNQVGLGSYSEAVWWTAMLMTTIGTEYSPQTGEGRILTFLLSLYAFAIFGYLTATIASYFIIGDAEARSAGSGATAGDAGEIAALRTEITRLRQDLRDVRAHDQVARAPEESADTASGPQLSARRYRDGEQPAQG